ncbi:hypothetical protein BHE74_00024280 [Ensete ventricosum]|nr:hypothetical protein BHE74_00024280 [Ensete ventricosum]
MRFLTQLLILILSQQVTSSRSWCSLRHCKHPLISFSSLHNFFDRSSFPVTVLLYYLTNSNGRPTFYRVYRRKSTEGFQSVPYVVALFSCMLWFCYAFLKTDAYLLITINSIGCAIETVYIVTYFTYAPKVAKIFTAKLVLLVNVGMFGLILLLTLLLSEGSERVRAFGWICVSFSASVFVAPLSVIMVLYVAYRNKNRVAMEHKLPEHIISIAKLSAEKATEIYATPAVHDRDKVGNEGQKDQEQDSAEEAKEAPPPPQMENDGRE